MSSRKTANVADIVAQANVMLATSTCDPNIRQGTINLLESILHATGNYRGFRYLDADEVPDNEKPGIILGKDSNGAIVPHLDYSERFKNTDYTRVKYFS